MIIKIFSVYDSKAEAFLPPLFMQSVGVARRSFGAAINEVGSDFNKYPGDFTLFELGEFNDSTAEFVLHDAPISLGVGVTYTNAATVVSLPLRQSN